MAALCIAGDPQADALLSTDPFALLVGMLLDQQIPMEKAFSGPAVIAARMGTAGLDPQAVADCPPEEFETLMAGPPAVHRYHRNFAGRVQTLARFVVDTYGGDAAAIWADVEDGPALLARLKALPGFGEQKAKIFVALLGKQLGVEPAGWREAAGDYGTPGSHRSVADVVDGESLLKVREFKKAMKAEAKAKAAR
ncbi:HhH-GPD-type base excision DNA repair protein [Kineosporia sp. R_H_3]|uniref:HhH-GPD-type base excision DNA repair protein n=1 Tax=Kineosporia sp. R_H_3 TaxID=1961848 RepID=UPI000B4AAA78|nr:HhH-GPD-type base excision DNA repair protein [Kineosporia sp. R_H_3]